MEQIFATLRYLARRYHGRWSAIDDALTLIRSSTGAPTKEGERARRMLENVFRQQTYVENERDAIRTDEANALKKLTKPLNEALGHIVTIELARERLKMIEETQKERWRHLSAAEKVERNDTIYGAMIRHLRAHGIVRGDYEILDDRDWNVIARYMKRKVHQRIDPLPPIRSDRETRGPEGRRHPFWNPYRMQWDGED